jgi:hypothetical protein
MKFILPTIAVLMIMYFIFSAVTMDVSGQAPYPATAYPAFTAVPIYEAYPTYAMPLPTFIPSPPPDVGDMIYDPPLVNSVYVPVFISTQIIQEQVEPTLTPSIYRPTVCQRYPGLCAHTRRVRLITTWIAE